MDIDVSREALVRIWEHLNAKWRPGRADGGRVAHQSIVEQGWGERHDLQDLLWETDDRADALARHHDDFDCLLAPNELHFIYRYRGPFSKMDEVWGHKALRAVDLAAFVMEIERLGFTVDAEPLVTNLRPGLLRQKFVTNGELAVLWYGKQRHRCAPIVLRAPRARPTTAQAVRTHSGYKATALMEDGKPVVLRVDASNSRKGLPLKYWVPGELSRAAHEMRADTEA